jgi:hypothetical protein
VATLFTWDWKTAVPVWNALKMHLSLGDEIQCFKALIVIHKIIRDGHPCVRPKMPQHHRILHRLYNKQNKKHHFWTLLHDRCNTILSSVSLLRFRLKLIPDSGYSRLIQAYVGFLKSKLSFHSDHPDFTANMDYQEFRALKKVDDPNEG